MLKFANKTASFSVKFRRFLFHCASFCFFWLQVKLYATIVRLSYLEICS